MYPYAVVLTGMQINEPFQTSVLMQAKCEEKKNKNERKNNSTSLDSWESWVEIHSMKKMCLCYLTTVHISWCPELF